MAEQGDGNELDLETSAPHTPDETAPSAQAWGTSSVNGTGDPVSSGLQCDQLATHYLDAWLLEEPGLQADGDDAESPSGCLAMSENGQDLSTAPAILTAAGSWWVLAQDPPIHIPQ